MGGSSVSILDNFAVVGACDQHRSGARDGAGFAYVYKSSSAGWSNHTVLTSSLANNHVYDSDDKSPIFGFSTAMTPNFIFVGEPNASTASIQPNNKWANQSPMLCAGNVSAYYLDTTTKYFKDSSRAFGTKATAGYNVVAGGVNIIGNKMNTTSSLSAVVGTDSDGVWADITLIAQKKFDG